MNEENFWNRVKALLKQNKLTQENLAEKAGLNFNNLKQQIFYNRIPDAVQSVAIAQVLETSVEYLVTGKNPGDAYKIPDDLLSVMRKYV